MPAFSTILFLKAVYLIYHVRPITEARKPQLQVARDGV